MATGGPARSGAPAQGGTACRGREWMTVRTPPTTPPTTAAAGGAARGGPGVRGRRGDAGQTPAAPPADDRRGRPQAHHDEGPTRRRPPGVGAGPRPGGRPGFSSTVAVRYTATIGRVVYV